MRAEAGDGLAHHLGGEPGRLHRAQALVVDRYGARLVHRRRIAFDEQAADAIDAEKIGQCQPGGTGANDCDGVALARQDFV